MKFEYTLRFETPSAIDRALGHVLTQNEVDTSRSLIGGFYFTSEREPSEMIAEFEAEGINLWDFRSFQFEPK